MKDTNYVKELVDILITSRPQAIFLLRFNVNMLQKDVCTNFLGETVIKCYLTENLPN